MPAIAGVDIGANGIRLAVGNIDKDRHLDVIERLREPVRLGQDAFGAGVISPASMGRCLDALGRFKGVMEKYGVMSSRVVATSALREAKNRDEFTGRISRETGLEVLTIGAEEEARLIYLAVKEQIPAKKKTALLVDIGGGSVEITIASDGQMISTASFALGTVRLMCELKAKDPDEANFNRLVHEYARSLRKQIKNEIGSREVDICVGTGGNIETLGDLRKELLSRDSNDLITKDELDQIVKKLRDSTCDERIKKMGLRPDRADVIVQAAIVLQRVMKQAGVEELFIPHVGLKEGLLLDIKDEMYGGKGEKSHREQVLSWARQLGRKYAYDEQHAEVVSGFAARLFNATKELHGLGDEELLLLETAAVLHDIGYFISVSKHHKHSYYLLTSTPIIGLGKTQMAVVANVARYHRMAFPSTKHEGYAALSPKDRAVTTKLAALLRVADSLDTEHDPRISDFSVELTRSVCRMKIKGTGDLMLEKWKMAKKAALFEETFNMKVVLE